ARLALAGDELAELAPRAAAVEGDETRLRAVEVVLAAGAAVESCAVPPEPPPADEAVATAARATFEKTTAELGALEGQRAALVGERDRARQAVDRSATLSGEGECPVCGQAL